MIRHIRQNLLSHLSFALQPATCILCGQSGQFQLDMCVGCLNDLPKLYHACQRCAHPLPQSSAQCGRCLTKPPYFDHTVAAWHYDFPIHALIKQFKFDEKLHIGRALATLFGQQLQRHYQQLPQPDCFIPVPLHRQRFKTRGFNQAILLGQIIQRFLPHIAFKKNVIRRQRNTQAQFDLARAERQLNIRDAFNVSRSINATHVAIIDDIITTGSTVNEMSRLLKQHGVSTVSIWCLARAT